MFIHIKLWINFFFPLQSIFILFIHFIIPNSCNNNKIETIFKEYMLQYIFLLAPNYNYLLYKQIELTNNFKTNSSNKKMWINHIKLTTYLLLLKHILNLLKEFVVENDTK